MTEITFRFVRQIIITGQDQYADINRTAYIADAAGEWIEKSYPNGDRSYKMAIDCNPCAVSKMRMGA
jgi:hypothetical protein